LHHSDRGSQYASYVHQAVLCSAAIQQSMSGTANCYDNAVMESFFASLKTELVHHTHFGSISAARAQVFHYIEAFYNCKRLHSSLGYLSPDVFEHNALRGLNSPSTFGGKIDVRK
jgi:transposase InsO family protein